MTLPYLPSEKIAMAAWDFATNPHLRPDVGRLVCVRVARALQVMAKIERVREGHALRASLGLPELAPTPNVV